MYVPTYYRFCTHPGRQNGLLLDGAPLQLPQGEQWRQIAATSYVGAYTIVSHGTHSIGHQDTSTAFGAYMYGAGDRESYAFPAGLCLQVLVCVVCFFY